MAGRALRICALSCVAVTTAFAHPLHTTLAELTTEPGTRALVVSLRVFADDFSRAAAGGASGGAVAIWPMPSDSAMFRYVRERFAVIAANGQAARLEWCGARRVNETLLLCLRTTSAWSSSGARVRSALLSEVFGDQVNMVQVQVNGRRRMLLFTNRDGAKALE